MFQFIFVLILSFNIMVLAQENIPEENLKETENQIDQQIEMNRKNYKKMKNKKVKLENRHSQRKVASEDSRYLALMGGGFIESTAYVWGKSQKLSDVAQSHSGLTYFVSEKSKSYDLSFRLDYQNYDIDHTKISKMSFLPMVSFPEASVGFPLYFGLAMGLGVYFKQVPDKSNLSLDYNLFGGVRLLNLYETLGFIFEAGLKNHMHLLSEGQMNATYWSLGVIFTF